MSEFVKSPGFPSALKDGFSFNSGFLTVWFSGRAEILSTFGTEVKL